MREEWLTPEEAPASVVCLSMASALRAVSAALGDPRDARGRRQGRAYPPQTRRRA